ncbi:MAG: Tyrosine recombinase XerC [Elusimicrobia bacterium]|nr:Tyrosine recombinase XerC [Elusimicrobiota bacterium]
MAVTLRKRGNSYSAYWREGGKVVEKALGTDGRMAKIKVGELEKQIRDKRSGVDREITWEDYKEKYLTFITPDHAKDTVIRAKSVLNNFDRAMKIRRLTDLTPEVLEEFKGIRKNMGIMGTTINRELVTLKTMMKKAAEWGYASTNIWGVRKMPEVKRHPVFFTMEEIDKLIAAADPFWRVVLHLGLYAGLRLGEMLNLRWVDVDFQRRRLKVAPNEQWNPKDREAREIPFHPDLLDCLKAWEKVSPGQTNVVPWNSKPNILSVNFSRLRKRAGIKRGSLHTLRHSFASHLAIQGVDMNRIRSMMGHSSIVTTQIYAHLLPSSSDTAVTKIPSMKERQNGHHTLPLAAGTQNTPEPAPAPTNQTNSYQTNADSNKMAECAAASPALV